MLSKILRSKHYLYTILQKVFFIIVKDLFKSFQNLRGNEKVQIGSKGEGNNLPVVVR